MFESPYPFQLIGADFLAARTQAFLADDMGLGKSVQAIRGADIVGAQDILVICPSSVRANWERMFEKFSPMDRPCAPIFTGKDPMPSSGVVVISYDLTTTRAHELKRPWDLLIIDEAHYLKERGAKRTKAVYGRSSTLPGIAAQAKHVWRLSGTPAPNNASELYTHLKSAGLTTEPYWDFVFRFCSGFNSDYGFTIKGHKNVDELRRILAPFLLRRTKEEVLKDLPPIRFEEVTVERGEVELDPTFYTEMKAAGGEAAFLDEIKVANQTLRQALETISNGPASIENRLKALESMAPSLSALRRYIGMAKLPTACDIIKEELESGQLQKIVLFAVHRDVVEGARQRFSAFQPVTLYGGTPADKRQRNIEKFMKDPKCRVFIGNIIAAGTGVDGLQKASADVAFLEQSWVPAENSQAAMRVHRIGQDNPVRVRIFSLRNSVDQQIQDALIRKMRELAKIF